MLCHTCALTHCTWGRSCSSKIDMLFSLLNFELSYKGLAVSCSSAISTGIMSWTFYLEQVLTTPWQHCKLLTYGSFTWRASWLNGFKYLSLKDDEKTNHLAHEVINIIVPNHDWLPRTRSSVKFLLVKPQCKQNFFVVILNILTASFPWVKWWVHYN